MLVGSEFTVGTGYAAASLARAPVSRSPPRGNSIVRPHIRQTHTCYGKHGKALLVRERVLVRDLPLLPVLEIIVSGGWAIFITIDLLLPLRDRAPLHVGEPPGQVVVTVMTSISKLHNGVIDGGGAMAA